ncbi:GGDEF domain-containing protein [Cellulomonas iranensis]|uniref:GGDEF domain-containing protein n=1 Tax=Cellulomonas iranensis TaxID=76862 RepID=A0ABU0GK16_9CELL|nr:GGDEF domain-containing protein [Cellulomonas iranensis]MDQ0424945.1 GGDEF domain-containing protein [Cellulomonas iranensis]
MTTDFGNDGRALPAGLRERWRHESVTSVWRRPSDWYHPAVDALAAAVLDHGDPTAAARDLGRARGEHGVGVGEALDDLVCLYRSTGVPAPPVDAVRALTEGWSDAQAALLVTGACTDPETGLPTRQYLAVRLEEAYLDAVRHGLDPAAAHGLVLVDVAAGHVTGLLRAARSAAVGAALRDAFGAGHPAATLGGGVFAVLTRAGDDTDARIAVLRAEVARRCEDVDVRVSTRQPVRVWVEPLPATHAAAAQRLAQLARPEPWVGIPRPAPPSVPRDHALHDEPGGPTTGPQPSASAGPPRHPGGFGLAGPGSALPPGLLAALWPDGPPVRDTPPAPAAPDDDARDRAAPDDPRDRGTPDDPATTTD